MKRLFVVFLLMMFALPSSAIIVDNTKDGKAQEMVAKTGFKILNANRVPYKMTFYVKNNKNVNAAAAYSDRSIYVYTGILPYIDNEDELAAVIAHEIGHGIDYSEGAMKGYWTMFPMTFRPRKYEYKADKRAIDLMVKAGYNPVAFITMGNKIFSQYRYQWYLTHPLASRRLACVYEYIYAKYPQYLVQNEYKDNIYYQNFLLTSRENRLKLQEKVKKNSKKRVNYL